MCQAGPKSFADGFGGTWLIEADYYQSKLLSTQVSCRAIDIPSPSYTGQYGVICLGQGSLSSPSASSSILYTYSLAHYFPWYRSTLYQSHLLTEVASLNVHKDYRS